MKKILLTIIFYGLLLNSNMIFAQFSQIKGNVIDSNKIPLEYFTAAILSSSDSSMITGGAFIDGYFEFSNIKQDKCLLQISCVGYQKVIRSVDYSVRNTVNVGTISMRSVELREVTVRAKRPTFKQVESKLIIDVQGTVLSEVGSLIDALKRSPGLIVDNDNNIKVSGKGTPIIYINNREVQNITELESLQSDDIESIEIDRNPSAEYSASGMAVVRIKTKKITKDKIDLQLYNREFFARKFSTLNGVQFNSSVNKTRVTVNYSYGYMKSKNYDDSYEINKQNDYVINNHNSLVRSAVAKKDNLFASISQEINKRNNIGFQYSYISHVTDQKSKAEQNISKTNEGTTEGDVFKSKDGDYKLQTYNLNYEFNVDSLRSLSVVGGYARVHDNSIEDIDEQNNTNNSELRTFISSHNDYDIYSGKVDYQSPIFKSIKFQSGIKLSKVENLGNVSSINQDSNLINYKTEDQIKDHIAAAYFTLRKDFSRFSLQGGLRYEYTDTDISSSGTTVLDSTYGSWFPTFLINQKISDKQNITLSYSKKINRPTFDELSTDITYFNSLSYKVGNPEVKPSTSHNVDLTLGLLKGLSANMGYKYEKNARILAIVNDENNPDIVKYTPINLDKAEYLFVNMDYNYSGRHFNSNLSFGVQKPFVEVPYMNEIRSIRKASWYLQSNSDYSITSRTVVFINYGYYSRNKELMTDWGSYYNLSVGLNTSFYSKRLKVSIMANDIFNSSDNSWEDKFGNIVAGSTPDFDNTLVSFTVKYNFNNFKGGIRKKSASGSELNRL